jgi:hypothetical protein
VKRSAPDARTVARRAIALHFVTLHAVSAQDAAHFRKWRRRMPAAQWRALRKDSATSHRSYLADARRWKCRFTPREQAFMDHRDTLELPERDHIEMTWRCESLRVLAWALRFSARLPQAHVATLDQELHGFKGNDPDAFLRQARLRTRRELEFERERSAARLRRDRGRQARELPFRWDVIGIARLGSEYYGNEWSPAVAIARERLHALNWLCGYAPGNRWDETPADMTGNSAVAARGVPRVTRARGPMARPGRATRRRIALLASDADGS